MIGWLAFAAALSLQTAVPASGAQHAQQEVVESIPQTPEHLALADKLVEAAQISAQQMKAVPQIVEMLMPLMVRGNEAHAEELREILTEEFVRIFAERRKELEVVARDAYARHLSDQELRDLTTFYLSPSGRRLVAVQPAITAESMAGGQEIGRRAMIDALPGIIERMREANLQIPSKI